MDLGISGMAAVVTGSSKGLGRGVALALANEGVSLVVAARGEEALEATRKELESTGVPVIAVAADVTKPDVPAELVRRCLETYGRIDIVVSNSGGPPPARALELSDEAIRDAIEANLLMHVRFVREALPFQRAAGWGRILAVASYGVVQPIPRLALSNLARTGLRAWAKTAAQDLADSGVTLNLIAPGVHATDRMKELGRTGERMGDPEDFGRVAAFLCSRHAGYVNGATLVVDGAATLGL